MLKCLLISSLYDLFHPTLLLNVTEGQEMDRQSTAPSYEECAVR